MISLTKKCRTKNGLRLKNRTRTGVKRKKKPDPAICVFQNFRFFPFFVRILKKNKNGLRFEKRKKNGKLPEKCQKKNGNFKKRKWTDPFFQISVFFPFFFPVFFIFRFFSGFFPFFKNAIRFLYQILETKKTDKKRTKDGILKFYFPYFFSFFPAFFKKSGKMPEKNGFIFFRQFAFESVFGSKTECNAGENPENPLRIKSGSGNLRLFSK